MKNKILRFLDITLIFALLLFSCEHTNKEVEPLVNEGLAYIEHYCPKYKYSNIKYKLIGKIDLPLNMAGVCMASSFGYVILFDEPYWDMIPDDTKYLVILHELNHCYTRKKHIDDPNNFMYPSVQMIEKGIVKYQFIKDIREFCKDGNINSP